MRPTTRRYSCENAYPEGATLSNCRSVSSPPMLRNSVNSRPHRWLHSAVAECLPSEEDCRVVPSMRWCRDPPSMWKQKRCLGGSLSEWQEVD